MDVKACFELIDETLEDDERHVDFKWLASKLNIPANNTKKILYEYLEHRKGRPLYVTYIVSGVLRENKMHAVKLLSQSQMQDRVNSLFELVSSKHVYSISKHTPAVSSDVYTSESHEEYKIRLSAVKIGTPVSARQNRFGASSGMNPPEVAVEAKKPEKRKEIKQEVKKEPIEKPVVVEKKKPEKKVEEVKRKAPEKKAKSPAKKKEPVEKPVVVTEKKKPEKKIEVVKKEPEKKVTEQKKKSAPVAVKQEKVTPKKTTKKAAPKKAKKRAREETSDDEDDSDDTTPGVQMDEEDDEYVPSKNDEDSDVEMSEAKVPVPSSPVTTTPASPASPDQIPGHTKRTKQVKKKCFKVNEKGYQVATEEWVEVEMTDQEIKEEEERERKASEQKAKATTTTQKKPKSSTSSSDKKSKTPKKKTAVASSGNIMNFFKAK